MASDVHRATLSRSILFLFGFLCVCSVVFADESSAFDVINPFDDMDADDHETQGVSGAAYLGDGNDVDTSGDDTNGDDNGNWLKGIENLVGLHDDDDEDRYSPRQDEDTPKKKSRLAKAELSDKNGDDDDGTGDDSDAADTTEVPASAAKEHADKAFEDATAAADLVEETSSKAKGHVAHGKHMKAKHSRHNRKSDHHHKGHSHKRRAHEGKARKHLKRKVKRSEGSLTESDGNKQAAEHAAKAAGAAASSAAKLAEALSHNSASGSSSATTTTTRTTTTTQKHKRHASKRRSDDRDISRMSKHEAKKTERELEAAEEEAEEAAEGIGEAEQAAQGEAKAIERAAGKEVGEAEDEVEGEVSGLEQEGQSLEQEGEEEIQKVAGEGAQVEAEGRALEQETENAVGAVAQEGLKSEAYQKKLSDRSKLLAAALSEEDMKVQGIAHAGDSLAERVERNERAIEATQKALKKTMEAANMEAEALEQRPTTGGDPKKLDHDASVFDKQHPDHPAYKPGEPHGTLAPEKAEAELTQYRTKLDKYRATLRSYRSELRQDEVKLAQSETEHEAGSAAAAKEVLGEAVKDKLAEEAGVKDAGDDEDDEDEDGGDESEGDAELDEPAKIVPKAASPTPTTFVKARKVAEPVKEQVVPSDVIQHDPGLDFIPDEQLFNGTIVAKHFDEEALKEKPLRIAPPPPGMTPPDTPKRGGDPHIGIRVMSREIVRALRRLLGIADGAPLPKEVTRVVRTALTKSFNSPSMRKALDIPVDETSTEIEIPNKGKYKLRLGTAVPGGAEFVNTGAAAGKTAEMEETQLKVPGINKWAKKLYYTLGAGARWKKAHEKPAKKRGGAKRVRHSREESEDDDDLAEYVGEGMMHGAMEGEGEAEMEAMASNMMGMGMGMGSGSMLPTMEMNELNPQYYPVAYPPVPTNGMPVPTNGMAQSPYASSLGQIQAAAAAQVLNAQQTMPSQYAQSAYAQATPRAPQYRRGRLHPFKRAARRFVRRRVARRPLKGRRWNRRVRTPARRFRGAVRRE